MLYPLPPPKKFAPAVAIIAPLVVLVRLIVAFAVPPALPAKFELFPPNPPVATLNPVSEATLF